MAFNSLRAQLLGWLLVPLALYAVCSAWFTYGNAMETATVIQDRLLLGSARMIAEQVHYYDGAPRVVIPPAALELFQSSTSDRVYYRIASANGSLLAGYAELPLPPGPAICDTRRSTPDILSTTNGSLSEPTVRR